MKTTVLSLVLAAVAVVAPLSARAAEIILTTPSADGSISGTFRNEGILGGDFTDTFTFDLPSAGRISGTISSVLTSPETNIDFTSVTLNGVTFTTRATGDFEFRVLDKLAIGAGPQVLVVSGKSGSKGSYAGTLSFTATPVAAVPEPAGWALMITGFAGAGTMLRARRRDGAGPGEGGTGRDGGARKGRGAARGVAGLALVAVALGLAPAAASAQSVDDDPRSVTVNFRDLDVNSRTGAEQLLQRLRRAAVQVCGPVAAPRELAKRARQKVCVNDTLAATVQSLDAPMVTARADRRTPEARLAAVR